MPRGQTQETPRAHKMSHFGIGGRCAHVRVSDRRCGLVGLVNRVFLACDLPDAIPCARFLSFRLLEFVLQFNWTRPLRRHPPNTVSPRFVELISDVLCRMAQPNQEQGAYPPQQQMAYPPQQQMVYPPQPGAQHGSEPVCTLHLIPHCMLFLTSA